MEKVAVSMDANEDGEVIVKEDLATIDVLTLDGDRYSFPAMSKSALEQVLPKDSNRKSSESLTLVNASTAILMIPMRICKEITVNGGTWWVSPV